MKGEPMGDCMNFPDTVDEYMEQYKMTDVRQVYSNGIEYVPIFRMKQWFEHEKDQPTIQPVATDTNVGDTISRQEAIDALDCISGVEEVLRSLPSIQPEPQEGHWIKHDSPDGGGEQYECSRCGVLWEFNDGTPEDNEAYFCPKCGTKMRGGRQK